MAIVTVLLVMAILAVIGLGIATMGMGHLTTAATQATTEKAYMAAEAAALYMMDEYRHRYSSVITAPGTGSAENGVACSNGSIALRWLDAANSPGVAINATIIEAMPPAAGVSPPQFTPPNASGPLTIANGQGQCAYIVGCGTVGNGTVTNTSRYVGLMVRRDMPGGVFFFGGYANNTLDASGNDGTVDAFNSAKFTSAWTTSSTQVPYVDVEGSGNVTDVSGQSDIWGHVDGPVVKTDSGTQFMNGFGTARQPGTQVSLPTIDWPNAHPSPNLVPDVTVSSGVVPLPGIPQVAPLVAGGSNARNVVVRSGGELRLEPLPGVNGSNFYFHTLTVETGGKLTIDTTLGGRAVNIFITSPTAELNITNATINSTSGQANATRIYHNGTNGAKIINSTIVGQVATDTGNPLLYVENSTVIGSVTAYRNLRLTNNATIHYDVSLRTAETGEGENIGIVSHQRL